MPPRAMDRQMSNRVSEDRHPESVTGDTRAAELESIVERLRSVIRKVQSGEQGSLGTDDLAILQTAARALDQVPERLREGMQVAFHIGREHGVKEELLSRLEREIAGESARLAREAWGRGITEAVREPNS